MKILIIGSNGQLGWELCRRAGQHGFEFDSKDIPEFDITDREAVNETLKKSAADTIINASAYTAVDNAESDKELAFAVNSDGPSYLASFCADNKIPLLHVSTDYVFDGKKKEPYRPTDPVNPIAVYRKSKAE